MVDGVVWGDAGNDTLVGSRVNDKLRGGLGDDTIKGRGDNDFFDLLGFPIVSINDFLNDALSRDKKDAIPDMQYADPSDPNHYTGTVRIVGAWGDIDAAGFIV